MTRSTIVLSFILALAMVAPAAAQDLPVWAAPLTVVTIGTVNGLTYAKIRDNTMHGHNVYCITQGAHFGKATVTHISAHGVELSDGRVLRIGDSMQANVATTQR